MSVLDRLTGESTSRWGYSVGIGEPAAMKNQIAMATPASSTDVRITASSTDMPYGLLRSSLRLYLHAGR